MKKEEGEGKGQKKLIIQNLTLNVLMVLYINFALDKFIFRFFCEENKFKKIKKRAGEEYKGKVQ